MKCNVGLKRVNVKCKQKRNIDKNLKRYQGFTTYSLVIIPKFELIFITFCEVVRTFQESKFLT